MWKGKKVKRIEKNTVGQALKNGSAFTRLSFLIMGFGQMVRGQFVKGGIYMLLQTAFTLFMLLLGGRYIAHLFSGNLGSRLSGEIWNEGQRG